MKKQLKLQGTITAIVTPFKKNGSVDVEALKKFVTFQVENGVNGIVPCGSTGEAATMTPEEMELVIRTTVQTVKGRVPIIAGAGSNDTHKAILLSKMAKKAGADGLLHVTPYYNKPTPLGLLAHFKAIADACDIPIVLYNVPGRTASNVTAETTLMIASKVPQVVAVKEASGDIVQMMKIVKGKPSYFSVLSGDDVFTLPLMSAGGHGIISVVSNEIPRAMSELTTAALSGDFETARKLHYEWMDLMQANFIETNPIPVKTATSMMGMMAEVFRLPLVQMSEKNKAALTEVLKKHKLIN